MALRTSRHPVFEEHRIPIDLIAGTSMGGLVGGIYATGADSGEMKELIDAIEWPAVLSADVPYPQKSFRRKEDARQAPAMIELLAKLAADEALPDTARVSAINTILKASGLGFKPGMDEKPLDRSKSPSQMTAVELDQMLTSLRAERDALAEEMAQALHRPTTPPGATSPPSSPI